MNDLDNVWKEFSFTVQETNPVVEAINLLNQVMDVYFSNHAPAENEVNAIAEWFYHMYKTSP